MVYTAAIKKYNVVNETITQSDSEEDEDRSDSAATPTAETNQIDHVVASPNRLTILADSVTEQQLLQLKSSSPKIVMSKIPIGLINTTNAISASNASALVAEQQRRLVKELNTQSQQQFKSLNTALVKMTPSKPSIYQLQPANSNNLAVPTGGIKRNSFIKFLERNTPSKLSKTELEEKRKIELMLKEQKEKERLLEQEKLKQEKRDETKKKRDEKLLKMKEMKQKQDQDMEKKRKEVDARLQQSAVKQTQANAAINLHKSVLLNSTKQVLPQLPQSSSATTLTAPNTTIVKKPFIVLDQLKTQPPANKKQSTAFNDKQAMEDFTNDFKSFKKVSQQLSCAYDAPENKPFQNKFKDTTNFANYDSHHHHQQQHNLETTYVLNSPSSGGKSVTASHSEFTVTHTNYAVTPLQPLKLKNIDNYDVSNLGSEDDTDDDEEPSKPIPEWAQPANLIAKVKMQNTMMINFTRLFKSASQTEINLEKIFKTKRKKFTERSSSANWSCPPVWKGNGLTGEESFMEFRKF